MIPTDTGLRPEILNPVAAPVDTYAAPAAGEQLGQLASALSDMSPGLSRFSNVIAERGQEQATQAGQNKARDLVESGKTYAQAIKEGLIDPHESPWFRLGAYETFGRVSANTYSAALKTAVASSDIAKSTNPKDFDTFEGQFRSQWAKQNLGDSQNPYFRNSFGTQADQNVNTQRQDFADDAGRRLVGQTRDAFGAEITQTVFDGIDQGQDAATTAAQIHLAMHRQMVTGGIGAKDLNDMTMDAIIAAAKSLRRPDLLDQKTGIASYVETAPGAKLANVPANSDKIDAAQEYIAGVTNREQIREKAQTKFKLQQQEESIYNELDKRMLTDGVDRSTVNYDDLLLKMTNLSVDMTHNGGELEAGGKVPRLMSIANAWATMGTKDDDATARSLNIDINTVAPGEAHYVTQSTIADAFGKKLLSQKTYREFSADLVARDKNNGGNNKAFHGPAVELTNKYIGQVLGMGYDKDGMMKPEYQTRLAQAEAEGTDQMLRWHKANPQATDEDVNKMAITIANAQAKYRIDAKKGESTLQGLAPPKFGAPLPPLPASFQSPVNFKKQLVTPLPVDIKSLGADWDKVKSGGMSKLSPRSLEILQNNKVKSDSASVEEFVKAQRKLIPQ